MRATAPFAFRAATILAAGCTLFLANAVADEVRSLRGKPSSDMILEALNPAANADAPAVPAQPSVRRRGLSLGNDESKDAAAPAPAAASSAAPVAAAAPAAAPSAPAAKTVAVAAAPQKSKPRALDLDIQFQFNSDQLTNDGKDVLDQLGTALKSDKLANAKSVVLEGHADAKGSPSYNQALSLKRAQAARTYLSSRHGIPSGKIRAVGKGATEPADPANPEDEINRRVRVIVDI